MCNDIAILLICSTSVRMAKIGNFIYRLQMQLKPNLTLIIILNSLFVKTDRGVSHVKLYFIVKYNYPPTENYGRNSCLDLLYKESLDRGPREDV